MPPGRFQPREIGIELVRGCNFSCSMCPVTTYADQETEKFQFIDLDLLAKLVREIDAWPSIENIWFFHFGEPMAHPKYRQCLEILNTSAIARQANVIQHTNASLLRGDKAEAILDTPIIKKLVFSFDGYGDKASYEVMRGPHYEKVLENIRAFTAMAKVRRPDLQLSTCSILPKPGELPMVGDPPPRAEAVAELHKIFQPLGVAVEIRDLHDYSGSDELKIAGKTKARIVGGCPFVEKDSLYFTVNGWAAPCCAVYDEKFNVGQFDPAEGFGALMNNPEMNRIRHSLRLDRREEVPHCSNCKFSLGAALAEPHLRRYWEDRDDAGLVENAVERKYIFGEVVPTEHRAVRVELGCGHTKSPGFIGMDRFELPGVDVVGDLDEPLPFESDSVDLVYASHSLEHVRDLQKTMGEVHRICRHDAEICIVAPYHMQKLNLANPYHTQVFNEHTPRFWTASEMCGIDPAEFSHPNSPNWGLLLSDNREAFMDLRCVRMEFFYFPDYEMLPPEERRQARMRGIDVCDQVVYHLIAIKRPVTREEFEAMSQKMHYYEPGYVSTRRLRVEIDGLRAEAASAKAGTAAVQAQLDEARRICHERGAELQEAQAMARFHADSAKRLIEKFNAAYAQTESLKREAAEAGAEAQAEAARLRGQMGGTAWTLAAKLRRLRHLLFPAGTLREKMGRRLMGMQRSLRRMVKR